ncbi:MAG: L,D-transpeptidase family protein [Planctomycetota bacterium]|jgi:LysM repeat protein
MALYSSGRYRRKRSRTWIYISLLIIGAVVFFMYRSSRKNKSQISTPPAKSGVKVKIEEDSIVSPQLELPKITAEPLLEPNLETEQLIAEALSLIDAQPPRVIDARDRLNEILHSMPLGTEQRARVKNRLSKLADMWLFSRRIFSQDTLCGSYTVKPGDLLSQIGKRYSVPYEIVMEINDIARAENFQANMPIKIIHGPFHARIYRSTFMMDLYLQNMFIRSFPVGLGREGRQTPTGSWIVKSGGKLVAPTWTDPDTGKTYNSYDADYPLGSRWIGLEGVAGQAKDRDGFAIHGTKNPDEIGAATSRGCIRLFNGDAILIYNLFYPGLSRVVIVE